MKILPYDKVIGMTNYLKIEEYSCRNEKKSVALATESFLYVWSRTLWVNITFNLFPPLPLIFVMYSICLPFSLLYNHQTLNLRLFLQTYGKTDWPTMVGSLKIWAFFIFQETFEIVVVHQSYKRLWLIGLSKQKASK